MKRERKERQTFTLQEGALLYSLTRLLYAALTHSILSHIFAHIPRDGRSGWFLRRRYYYLHFRIAAPPTPVPLLCYAHCSSSVWWCGCLFAAWRFCLQHLRAPGGSAAVCCLHDTAPFDYGLLSVHLFIVPTPCCHSWSFCYLCHWSVVQRVPGRNAGQLDIIGAGLGSVARLVWVFLRGRKDCGENTARAFCACHPEGICNYSRGVVTIWLS